ncbi:MAG: MinD/ParA family protein [Desulfobacteraceae bacterium]|nr:MinD/ParA family protein [Desulfobacteraceae bacterium]MCF8094253.1 MinD/ParA family protein [Desulfobacteraceae bacterium]
MQYQGRRDQAGTLRQLSRECKAENGPQEKEMRAARVMSVTSGKGGVGKTVCVANLAVVMARQGYRVLVIDADLGLANIDIYFGLSPQFNLNHFFAGQKSLDEILVPAAEGITVLPAGSGAQQYTNLESAHKLNLMEGLEALHGQFDVVLIDTEAGISENVTYFNVAAQEILVVTTPEPTAISDVYALMKLLSTRYYEKQFKLIVNCVVSENEALDVYHKLTLVSTRFIDISIDFLGAIPLDKRFTDSVRRQQALAELYPASKPSTAFAELVGNLELRSESHEPKGTQQFFWERLLSFN